MRNSILTTIFVLICSVAFASPAVLYGSNNQEKAIASNPLTIGGSTGIISVDPTIYAGGYTTGMDIGGKITIANAVTSTGGTGIINSIVLTDKAKQNLPVDVVFFSSDPSSTTITDDFTLTVADADLVNIIGSIPVSSLDYINFADNSVATVKNQGLSFSSTTTTIYAAVVARGSATYASTSDLRLKVKIYKD